MESQILESPTNIHKYFLQQTSLKGELVQAITDCHLGTLGVRFHLWRVLLGLAPLQHNIPQLKQIMDHQRKQYWDQANKLFLKTSSQSQSGEKKPNNNPLALLAKPKLSQQEIEQQSKIKSVQASITRDMPKLENNNNATILPRVLAVWLHLNPDIQYDVSLVFILDTICQEYRQHLAQQNEKDPFLVYLHNKENIQADVYTIFSAIMRTHKELFRVQDIKRAKTANPSTTRLTRLLDTYLRALDIELYRHLKLKDVAIKPVLTKWLRQLVCREFDLQQKLCLWDNILYENYLINQEQSVTIVEPDFEYLDFVCLAMLVYPRDLVLNKQSSYEIAQFYTKYPSLKGQYLQQLVNLAGMLKYLVKEEKATSTILAQTEKKRELFFMDKKYMAFGSEEQQNTNQSSTNEQGSLYPAIQSSSGHKDSPVTSSLQSTNSSTIQPRQNQTPTTLTLKPLNKPPGEVSQSSKTTKEDNNWNPLRLTSKPLNSNPSPVEIPKLQIHVNMAQHKETQKPKISSPAINPTPVEPTVTDFRVTGKVWSEVESLLKKSIEENIDVQSKSLCMKALKLLQSQTLDHI